jgi:hypothetical protein
MRERDKKKKKRITGEEYGIFKLKDGPVLSFFFFSFSKMKIIYKQANDHIPVMSLSFFISKYFFF